jgi:hypothetical protein
MSLTGLPDGSTYLVCEDLCAVGANGRCPLWLEAIRHAFIRFARAWIDLVGLAGYSYFAPYYAGLLLRLSGALAALG